MGEQVELVEFDFENPDTYATAVEGVDRVFLVGPPMRVDLDKLVSPFIDFMKKNNILRVVYIAAMGLDAVKELPFHAIIINKLKEDGFDYTVLAPSFFASNFKNYEWDNITQRGITYSPAGSGKVAFIAVEDIGNVGTSVLTEDGHIGKTYELTGPELLSYYDVADLLSSVLEKKIVYPEPSPEEYRKTLHAAGAPDFVASYMIAVYSMIATNVVSVTTDNVLKITGKKPTSLKEVLQRDFASIVV